ncbi:recombinase XerD [Rhodococcus oxybenzonivorans]|uniref:Recombinase XerD n=1 Tax=Rhodococcus oxybenzonivorans TaxID=1990687 RepID=A0A2S2C068_9NOCA|nr:site-specific integrase [Rhodococcus oxybenzonivorans]AWK74262.1 recombinase XerD [Rhodococcus oxybenzonivorans]
MSRRLPPGVRKITLPSGATRYELIVDAGPDPDTGKRRQTRKRFRTEKEVRTAYSEITSKVGNGEYTTRNIHTVDKVCADYLNGRHRLRPTSLSKLEYDLQPLRQLFGDLKVQQIKKSHIDEMIRRLRDGGTVTAAGRVRKPWSARSVNKTILAVHQVLDDARKQGLVMRNVADGVDALEVDHVEMKTFTPDEVEKLLTAADRDRNGQAWHLALCGLRRGEICGLRWADVDLDKNLLAITNTRTSAGGRTTEGAPKSKASRRVLPIPTRLRQVLVDARERQVGEKANLGVDYVGDGSYVVSNEVGQPYSPAVLSRYWRDITITAGVRPIRLHDARHTAATTMHLQGVPVAVIAQWIGHSSAAFTMQVYAHSQDEALLQAASVFGAAVTHPVTEKS